MTKKMNRRELIQKTLARIWRFNLYLFHRPLAGDDADSNTQPTTQVQFLHGYDSGDPLQTQKLNHLDTRNTIG